MVALGLRLCLTIKHSHTLPGFILHDKRQKIMPLNGEYMYRVRQKSNPLGKFDISGSVVNLLFAKFSLFT